VQAWYKTGSLSIGSELMLQPALLGATAPGATIEPECSEYLHEGRKSGGHTYCGAAATRLPWEKNRAEPYTRGLQIRRTQVSWIRCDTTPMGETRGRAPLRPSGHGLERVLTPAQWPRPGPNAHGGPLAWRARGLRSAARSTPPRQPAAARGRSSRAPRPARAW